MRFALLLAFVACGGQPSPEAQQPKPLPTVVASATPPPKHDAIAEAYFPLVEGARHAYVGSFEGRTYHETILTRRVGSSQTFYFVEQSRDGKPNAIVGTAMAGAGVYEDRNGDVYTGPAFYGKDVQTAHATELFLPRAPTKDQRIAFNTGDHEVTLIVTGPKSVHVPAGDFPDALQLELRAEGRTGELVLARGVGVIRWKRQTGRVDELESVTLPPH